ncbi:MAG: NAD(P)/FAD-dependent oxidoreductase [Lachnobacterium sp.]|nr:NAD(P)/FAD-dependent oxidoreductase [Lachnobacterium sp.]
MSKKSTKLLDVIVIGAGASGMMAAITAARRGKSVAILERMNKPGKKILATGNGKCNFTNNNMDTSCFHGNIQLIQSVLSRFSKEEALSFFHEIGIWPKEKNGYYYPNSGQAVSVAEALKHELDRLQVPVYLEQEVLDLFPDKYGFQIKTVQTSYTCRNVIIASGLLAAPKLGSDGSMFSLIKELGHRFVPVLPALCGFYAKGMHFSKVAGVRCDANLTLKIDGNTAATEQGELQLADYGISGIPVFQISSPAVRALYEKKSVTVVIDFLPDISLETLNTEFAMRIGKCETDENADRLLCGLLNQKLIPVLLKYAGIRSDEPLKNISLEKLERLSAGIHDYPVTLEKVRDFEFAQVCTGGIRTEEINEKTLESRLLSGLYFAGEILDVDGICGGYNLQWAWSSGYVAGCSVS